MEVARRWGIRVVGPNCISVDQPGNRPLPALSGHLARLTLRLGPASVVAQSGGVSITYLRPLSRQPASASTRWSASATRPTWTRSDYLRYLLAEDPGTEIMLLYLESVDDGRQLMELARADDQAAHHAQGQSGTGQPDASPSRTPQRWPMMTASSVQPSVRRASCASRTSATRGDRSGAGPPAGDWRRAGDHLPLGRPCRHRRRRGRAVRLPPAADPGRPSARRCGRSFRADVIDLTNPTRPGGDLRLSTCTRRSSSQCLQRVGAGRRPADQRLQPDGDGRRAPMGRRVEQIVRATGRPVAFCAYAKGETRLNL
jgi:hypothetical protein